MTELTLDNWKEQAKLVSILAFTGASKEKKEAVEKALINFIESILTLQKQAVKDEAVKRIEEEKTDLIEKDYNANHVESRYHLINDIQDIIRNLD